MHRTICALALFIILGVAIQTVSLNSSLWNDELSTWVRSSIDGFSSIVEYSASNDNHPPGAYLIYSLWIGIAGDDPLTLRLSSLISYTLTILAIYVFTAKIICRETGLTAVLIFTFSPNVLELGRMFRAYSPLILLSLLLLWLTAKLSEMERPSIGVFFAAYVAVAILAEYAHYFGALVSCMACFYLIFLGLHRKRNAILLAGLLPITAYLPWLPSALGQTGVDGYLAGKGIYTMVYDTFALTGYHTPIALVLWTGFAAGVWVLARKVLRQGASANRSMLVVLGWFAVPVIVAFVVSLTLTPVVTTKNMTVVLPAFIIVASWGLLRVAGKRTAMILAVAIGATGAVRDLRGNSPLIGPGDEQFEEAVRWVAQREDGKTARPLYALAWNGRYFDYYLARYMPGTSIDTTFTDLDGVHLQRLKDLAMRADTAYLIYGHLEPPGSLEDSLAPGILLADSVSLRRAGAMLLVEAAAPGIRDSRRPPEHPYTPL